MNAWVSGGRVGLLSEPAEELARPAALAVKTRQHTQAGQFTSTSLHLNRSVNTPAILLE